MLVVREQRQRAGGALRLQVHGKRRRKPSASRPSRIVADPLYRDDRRPLDDGCGRSGHRNIAFFRYLKSPISFYQMVGRGTRLDGPTGKLMFTVYDYTDATRLFGQAFITKLKKLSRVDGAARRWGAGPLRPKW